MKAFLLLALCCSIIAVFGQSPQIDTLKTQLATSEPDSNRCKIFIQLSRHYYNESKIDSAAAFAQKGLLLSEEIGFLRGKGESLQRLANAIDLSGNYAKALDLNLQALKIFEQLNDFMLQGRILANVGFIYNELFDFRKCLQYSFKALQIAENAKDTLALNIILSNIGDSYEKLDSLNLASKYTNMSLENCWLSSDSALAGTNLSNLGNINRKKKNNKLAMEYYHLSIPLIQQAGNVEVLAETYLGIAQLYERFDQRDSCEKYAKEALRIAGKAGVTQRVLAASTFLANYYKKRKQVDSAYAYLQITVDMKDSLFNHEKLRQIQSMTLEEAFRQDHLLAEKNKKIEERKIKLQYWGISIGILFFVIAFLLLARSVIVNEKWISFIGILSLLLLFEFVNLLVHTNLSGFADHSPLLLLILQVVIASFLIPLHHKLEYYVTHQIVVKNKKLRLAAAKKTLQELEPKLKQGS